MPAGGGKAWGGIFLFSKICNQISTHRQIIPVKCNQIAPPQLHIAVNPKAEPKKGTIKISPNKTVQSFINVAASPKIHVPVAELQLYVLTIIRVTLRRIHKPLGESPHFVSLNILFLVKGTKKVSFISFQSL